MFLLEYYLGWVRRNPDRKQDSRPEDFHPHCCGTNRYISVRQPNFVTLEPRPKHSLEETVDFCFLLTWLVRCFGIGLILVPERRKRFCRFLSRATFKVHESLKLD